MVREFYLAGSALEASSSTISNGTDTLEGTRVALVRFPRRRDERATFWGPSVLQQAFDPIGARPPTLRRSTIAFAVLKEGARSPSQAPFRAMSFTACRRERSRCCRHASSRFSARRYPTLHLAEGANARVFPSHVSRTAWNNILFADLAMHSARKNNISKHQKKNIRKSLFSREHQTIAAGSGESCVKRIWRTHREAS